MPAGMWRPVVSQMCLNMFKACLPRRLSICRYYYHCDVLGIMVWQDQASATEKEGDCFKVPPWTRLQPGGQDAAWPDWARKQFLMELKEMVDTLHNSPAVVVWVPFNEAWGQHDTLEIAKWLQAYDPSRLLNIASGGNFFEVGDIVDHHNYPEATFPMDERFQPFIKVVGEFGGHGLVLPEEHLWQTSRKNWGYDVLKDHSDLNVWFWKVLKARGLWVTQTTSKLKIANPDHISPPEQFGILKICYFCISFGCSPFPIYPISTTPPYGFM